MKLSMLRRKIDQINHELLILFAKRLEISKEIGRIKKKHKLPIHDPIREASMKAEVRQLAKELHLNPSTMEQIFQIILEYTKTEMAVLNI